MCFCRYFVSLSQVRYEHPYQQKAPQMGCFFVGKRYRTRTHLNAARMSAAGEGSTEPLHNFLSHRERNCKSSPVARTMKMAVFALLKVAKTAFIGR